MMTKAETSHETLFLRDIGPRPGCGFEDLELSQGEEEPGVGAVRHLCRVFFNSESVGPCLEFPVEQVMGDVLEALAFFAEDGESIEGFFGEASGFFF
jgi:hypothetical protein